MVSGGDFHASIVQHQRRNCRWVAGRGGGRSGPGGSVPIRNRTYRGDDAGPPKPSPSTTTGPRLCGPSARIRHTSATPSTRIRNASGSALLLRRASPGAHRPVRRLSAAAAFGQVTTVTTESDVAAAVYRAANDASGQLRSPAGADALALAR